MSIVTLAIVVPTKNRAPYIETRAPYWARVGFDEVMVVDGSGIEQGERVRQACRENGLGYAHVDGNRAIARNIGAKTVRTDWVWFLDDDDFVFQNLDVDALKRLMNGHKVLVNSTKHAWWFDRSFFLGLGGYDERVILGDDVLITEKALAATDAVGYFPDEMTEGSFGPELDQEYVTHYRLAMNHFEYGMTFLYILKEVKTKKIYELTGRLRTVARLVRQLLHERTAARAYYLWAALTGLLVSPIHLVWPGVLRRELV